MVSDDLICIYVLFLLFPLVITSFCGCCLHQGWQADLTDLFLKFVEENCEYIDIDKFVKDNHITLNDFYEKVLRRIVNNKKEFQTSITYCFQGHKINAVINPIGVFARSLCLQYLSIPSHSSVERLPAEEFLKVCDYTYLLNTEPSNLQKKILIYNFITSPNRCKFIASCLFLLDKKIRGFHNKEIFQNRNFLQVTQQGAITYIKRTDCQDFVLIVGSEGYLTAQVLSY